MHTHTKMHSFWSLSLSLSLLHQSLIYFYWITWRIILNVVDSHLIFWFFKSYRWIECAHSTGNCLFPNYNQIKIPKQANTERKNKKIIIVRKTTYEWVQWTKFNGLGVGGRLKNLNSHTHQNGITNILFNIFYFLLSLCVRKSIDMQYSHLLDDGRFSRFTGAK